MASNGTSGRVSVGGQDFLKRNKFQLSPVENDGVSAVPPTPTGNVPTQDMYAYQNNYKDVSFPKICPPTYGNDKCVARLTGIPINKPDFIADFHFISLMRSIDRMLQHRYKGTITGTYSTPGASKK